LRSIARRIDAPSIEAVGFWSRCAKPAPVHYRPVIDQFPITPALDPAALLAFVAVFALAALATARRASYGAAALVFVTPFTFYHDVLHTTVTFPKAALLGVFVGLVAHRSSWRADAGARLVGTAFAAILGAIALSAIGAHHRLDTLRELLKWMEYGLFFAAIYCGYRIDPNAPLVRGAFFASIAVVCLSALAQEAIGAPFGIWIGDKPAPRISGFLEGPNQLAAYLEVAIAALAAWQMRRPDALQRLLLPLAAITFCLTFSRGAAVGIAASVVAFWWIDRRASLRAILPLAAGTVLGLLGDAGWVVALRSPLADVVVRPGDVGSGNVGGLGTRSELWRAALYFFIHHPLFGIGAGNYEYELADAGVYGVQTQANNWYLQQLAEGGIVLFGATIAWIAAVFTSLRRQLENPWTLAAFAASIALVVHQTFDYVVFYPKIAEPWIALIALGIAAPLAERVCA
jgi:hypothetical protein